MTNGKNSTFIFWASSFFESCGKGLELGEGLMKTTSIGLDLGENKYNEK